MKKVISMVVLVVLVATMGSSVGFHAGCDYERENFKYEFYFSESDKEALRASFLASGATAISEDVFELSWSEGERERVIQCDLALGLTEREIHEVMVIMNELACYLNSTELGRDISEQFNRSESYYMP